MTQSQMMTMMHEQRTQITMMHPQSCGVMKKKKRQLISKRKKTTTPTIPAPTPTPTTTSTSEPSLPDDIIFSHILPKLPVRSLHRFDCVSKLWYTTIHHDPKFHASHFTHAQSNPSLVAMLLAKSAGIRFVQLLKEGGGGGHHHHHHHHRPNPNGNNYNNNITSLELDSGTVHIFGTCNGLTCHRLTSGIQVCNPSTRELLNFSRPKPTTQTERDALMRNGFGFDPVRNEYKVIHLRLDYDEYYDCRVYTLGTNKWRNVTATCNYQTLICHPDDSTPICISGTLFWRTTKKSWILSFDLHHEKFLLIPVPRIPQGSTLHTLFDLEGSLCVVNRYDDDLKGEVQLTLFTLKDHHFLRLMHTMQQLQQHQHQHQASSSSSSSSSSSGGRWIRSGYIHLPLKPDINFIRFVEFAKHVYLNWVTTDGLFILWDVNRNKWIHHKLLGLSKWQWVLLVNQAENLLSLKTFVPPSAGEVEVIYLSSREARHDRQQGEMKKKKRRRLVGAPLGYHTIPSWLSVII